MAPGSAHAWLWHELTLSIEALAEALVLEAADLLLKHRTVLTELACQKLPPAAISTHIDWNLSVQHAVMYLLCAWA